MDRGNPEAHQAIIQDKTTYFITCETTTHINIQPISFLSIFFRCVNMVHVYAITAKTQRCFSSIALMCVEYVCLGVKPVHCHYHFVSNTHGRVWLLMKNCLGIPYDQTQSHLSQQEMSVSPHRRDSSLMMPSRPVLCCSPAASLLF